MIIKRLGALLLCLAVASLSSCTGKGETEEARVERLRLEAYKKYIEELPDKGSLTKAAATGDLDKILYLVKAGARVNENLGTREDEITPLLSAVVYEQEPAVALLLELGASCAPRFRGHNAYDFALYISQNSEPSSPSSQLFEKFMQHVLSSSRKDCIL